MITRYCWIIALAVAAISSAAGCGTILNTRDYYRKPPPAGEISKKSSGWVRAPRIPYGGFALSALFGGAFLFRETDIVEKSFGLYLLAIDTPLSLIGDTITLPITLPTLIKARTTDQADTLGTREPENNKSPGDE